MQAFKALFFLLTYLKVSLGKPSSAALENLTAQTEAFLNAASSRAGGKASFVHVREDFLILAKAGLAGLGW